MISSVSLSVKMWATSSDCRNHRRHNENRAGRQHDADVDAAAAADDDEQRRRDVPEHTLLKYVLCCGVVVPEAGVCEPSQQQSLAQTHGSTPERFSCGVLRGATAIPVPSQHTSHQCIMLVPQSRIYYAKSIIH